MKIFLDLEQTIISEWGDPVLCNVDKLTSVVPSNSEVTIFSFAIWNEKDQQVFEASIKPMIEEALNVKVVSWPSIKDFISNFAKTEGQRFDTWEFAPLVGKINAFINWTKTKEVDDCVLIDDIVPDMTVVLEYDDNRKIIFRNVNSNRSF